MKTNQRAVWAVGTFILLALMTLIGLAFQVSGFGLFSSASGYDITAQFDDIGNLKVRAPVRMAGVTIGRVEAITLDKRSFRATVHMHIDGQMRNIPQDSSASILTAGLLGANYVGISPGNEDADLVNGGEIDTTYPAFLLESLIAKLVYSDKES